MSIGVRTFLIAMIAAPVLAGPGTARADIVVSGGFGPNGDVGFVTSPPGLSITFGAAGQGTIYQMDGFVNVPGKDFGSGPGVGADLANGPPSGLAYTFAESRPNPHQLLITYQFVNNTGAALPGFQFLYFVDPDIGPNFSDESAKVNGLNKLGLPNPTSFQVGDPSLSSIFSNLLGGTLNNTNGLPSSTPGDVSTALGFSVGTLGVGKKATVDVLLSDDGSHTGGNFFITQQDPVFPGDSLTVSGVVVPEPSAMVSMAIGVLGLGFAFGRRLLGQAWTRSQ